MKNSKQISTKDLITLVIRSFSIEASFNYERMMSLGYAYSIEPILKKLFTQPEELKSALQRHLGLFNTTSVASPFILGVSVSQEMSYHHDPTIPVDVINKTKTDLMGPLAGISDGIFWGTLRIISAVVGITMAMNGSYWGPISFLLLFNIPNLTVRILGLKWGYLYGVDSLETIYPLLERIVLFLNIVVSLLFGAILVHWIKMELKAFTDLSFIGHILSSVLFAIVLLCIRHKVSVSAILWGIILLSIISVYAGVF